MAQAELRGVGWSVTFPRVWSRASWPSSIYLLIHADYVCFSPGSISQTLTYPFDVLRRKMQVTGMQNGAIKYNGAIDALKSIIRVEGVAGLYRGIWPNLRA